MVTRNYSVRGEDAVRGVDAVTTTPVAAMGSARRGGVLGRPLVRPPALPVRRSEEDAVSSPRAAAARIAEELAQRRDGRFQYLGDRTLEVTDSLKGYNQRTTALHLASSRGSSTDAIYRAEPGRAVGSARSLRCPPQWMRERCWLPGTARLLRWSAPLAALLLALAIVLYFLMADMPNGSGTSSSSGSGDVRGHPWASGDGVGGNAVVTDDDVVSLDGDVILDLGDVTYHEGQFHRGREEGDGRTRAKKQKEQQKEQQQQLTSSGAEAADEGGGGGGGDFMEIVPAPDLGTSAATAAAQDPPSSRATTQHEDLLYATSQLLAKLKATAHQHEREGAKAASTSSSKGAKGGAAESATKRSPAPHPPPATVPALQLSSSIVSATAPPAITSSAASPILHLNDSDEAALCFSPRLPLCRGVLPYDLTTLPLVPGVRRLRDLDAALPYFDMVVESGCSARARQFVCSLLEPACQPAGAGPLLPCRKACKAVAEDCNDFILATLDLSRVFQCERYPDLEHSTQCVNFARGDSCLRGEFRCPDGSCVPGRWRCDGVRDCPGGADERNCATCNTDDEFRCEADHKCVPLRWRCDAQRDCTDGSDEFGCPPPTQGCAAGHFQCRDQSACVPERWLCDGLTHCPDASDERNCSAAAGGGLHCHAGDFECRKTRQCIPAQWRCNGVNDCADNSDEDHCTVIHAGAAPPVPPAAVSHGSSRRVLLTASPPHTSPCPVGELRCLDGRCITVQQLCDRRRDCTDGADEVNCGGGDGD